MTDQPEPKRDKWGGFTWGDWRAVPNNQQTHDGLPLYDLYPLALITYDQPWYDCVYIDGQFYPYSVERQEYLAIPGRLHDDTP